MIYQVEGWLAAIELSGKDEDERNARMNEWKNCLEMKSNWETAAILMNHMVRERDIRRREWGTMRYTIRVYCNNLDKLLISSFSSVIFYILHFVSIMCECLLVPPFATLM